MVKQKNNGSQVLRKVAIFFMIFPVAIHVLVYATYFAFGTLVFEDLAYSELSGPQLTSMYPHLGYLIMLYIRTMGIVMVVLEVFVLYGAYLTFWKASKAGWAIATLGSSVPLITELLLTFPVIGFNIPYMAYILLTVMTAIALPIAGRNVFGRKSLAQRETDT